MYLLRHALLQRIVHSSGRSTVPDSPHAASLGSGLRLSERHLNLFAEDNILSCEFARQQTIYACLVIATAFSLPWQR